MHRIVALALLLALAHAVPALVDVARSSGAGHGASHGSDVIGCGHGACGHDHAAPPRPRTAARSTRDPDAPTAGASAPDTPASSPCGHDGCHDEPSHDADCCGCDRCPRRLVAIASAPTDDRVRLDLPSAPPLALGVAAALASRPIAAAPDRPPPRGPDPGAAQRLEVVRATCLRL